MDHPATTATNRSTYDYLDYYLSLSQPPKYAVLINGSWGTGKTHLIQNFIAKNFRSEPTDFRGWLSAYKKMLMQSWIWRLFSKEANKQPEHCYIYVSLYGTDSIEDINDRIICAAFPGLNVKTAKIIGGITRSALKIFRFETSLSLKNFISKFHKQLYIFDDFERSNLPSKMLLGYINEFIEHGDRKVIIIANEDEINEKDKDEYLKSREKVIGKSLTIQTTTHEALEHFTNTIKHKAARQLITDMQEDIIRIFHHSECHNLRILRQTLWDFERIFAALPSQQQQNSKAMASLVNIIVIFSIEIAQKKIGAVDILSRPVQAPSFLKKIQQSKPEEQAFIEMENRHLTVDLRDQILSNTLLSELLIQGTLDADAIRSSLANSVYFIREEDMPALDALRRPYELTEERFKKNLAQFEAQYKERIFISPQDIFETFALRLWLSSQKSLTVAHSRILSQGKQYLQDLYDTKRLPILTPKDLEGVKYGIFTGHYRLAFQGEKSAEAEAFFCEFKRLSDLTQNDLDVESATQLLEDMKCSVERLVYRLSYSSHREVDHIHPAILLQVQCKEFVSTLLDLHPKQQQIILGAFRARYSFTPISAKETGEREWLFSVREMILTRAQELSLFQQQRLSSNVENFLDPYIEDIRSLKVSG
ncbi:hypothetical protein FGA82_28240 [Pseudomonas fluorescens]|uniref:P-loop NTPase fold protein n=1 Tax=Pseudomonas fluorescens TaxID=294 RepID=UPI00113272CC|nr:P-loop NTPase fold protein [Pseudomonas fluorescens]TMU70270.1 hypothetical protein FGA82_28240 [Pseudomonas fluorescens]